jgi:maltose phosphorylase
VVMLQNGTQLIIKSTRFLSMVSTEIGAFEYSITACNKTADLQISSYINSYVQNKDANYNETFWEPIQAVQKDSYAILLDATKKTPYNVPVFALATGMCTYFEKEHVRIPTTFTQKPQYISENAQCTLQKDETLRITKFGAQVSSHNYSQESLIEIASARLKEASSKGFNQLLLEHTQAWLNKWELSDIQIKGDVLAQQGIRFNIFQLQQTYTGADSRLNIGPKGFTGEKYGGATYWDTEAFCLPFYLATSPEHVAKNLLLYRYNQLPQAIENAKKLGFTNGAALYPMVTMTGDECHNEWEITFEEIHRNGAIAYAIYNYVNYTGDKTYLAEYGLEVLIAIARFWAQRVHFSQVKKKYVMHGVTGPNEYENNINNNWYTNYFARWCIQYTLESISWLKRVAGTQYDELKTRIAFDESIEIIRWTDIVKNMYLPVDYEYGLILQQEGYLDKDLKTVAELNPAERPINQHWSWDRILRSCYIKQADVVQGLYVFEQDFDEETIRKNFEFYEARCVHESSLSPCIHSVVASKINESNKAYELYVRTARLDLDDYNKEAHEGLHITSMSGSWLAIVQGFAGMRVINGALHFTPRVPKQWESFTFYILFRGATLRIKVAEKSMSIHMQGKTAQYIYVNNTEHVLSQNAKLTIKIAAQK